MELMTIPSLRSGGDRERKPMRRWRSVRILPWLNPSSIAIKDRASQKADDTVDTSVNQIEDKSEIKTVNQGEKMIKNDPDAAVTPQGATLKTTGKKKIIRRVIKKKVYGTKGNDVNAIKNEAGEENGNVASQEASKGEEIETQVTKKDEEPKTLSLGKGRTTETNAKTEKESKMENMPNKQKSKSDKGVVAKDIYSRKDHNGSQKERMKDKNEKKSKDTKHDSEQKSHKERKKESLRSRRNIQDYFCKENGVRNQRLDHCPSRWMGFWITMTDFEESTIECKSHLEAPLYNGGMLNRESTDVQTGYHKTGSGYASPAFVLYNLTAATRYSFSSSLRRQHAS